MSDIVPFGKYRGQPVDALLADQDYLRWAMAQPGIVAMLQARHPAIFNIITVGAPNNDDTPDHNRLQARFLDRKFQEAFIECVSGEVIAERIAENRNADDADALKALAEFSVFVTTTHAQTTQSLERYRRSLADEPDSSYYQTIVRTDTEELFKLSAARAGLADYVHPGFPALPPLIKVEFELGYDVRMTIVWQHSMYEPLYDENSYKNKVRWPAKVTKVQRDHDVYTIEVKPLIGDDFPAVLRQVKQNGADIVVAGRFEAAGATLEQARQMFGDKSLVLLAEIEALIV